MRSQGALGERKFLMIPAEKAGYYDNLELFRSEVANRFPQANYETTEAGSCYATGNSTACVFHLARAVEVAARIMVSALKVSKELKDQRGRVMPAELCTWHQLLAALQKGVDAKSAKSATNVKKKDTFGWYKHAVSQFRNFRDAWRNKVSQTDNVSG